MTQRGRGRSATLFCNTCLPLVESLVEVEQHGVKPKCGTTASAVPAAMLLDSFYALEHIGTCHDDPSRVAETHSRCAHHTKVSLSLGFSRAATRPSPTADVGQEG